MPDAAHDFLAVPGFQLGFGLIRFLNEIKWSLVNYPALVVLNFIVRLFLLQIRQLELV